MIEQERWNKFEKRDHLLHIGAELMRASGWQHSEKQYFVDALTRGIDLVVMSLRDPKWQEEAYILEGLRHEMEQLINGTSAYSVETLYNAL